MESVAVPVVDAKLAAARQVLLTVSAKGTSLPSHYTVPGQYAKLALEDGVPRTYAIASAPNGDTFEFLLKVPEERVATLLSLTGEKVQMQKPQGKGFNVDGAKGKNLWLMAVGSGIAPFRAVLDWVLPRRADFLDVSLLYGVREAADLAFAQRFGAWAGSAMKIVPVVSQPKPGTWDGKTGHIQDHMPKSFDDPRRTVAFVCGLPEMDREVTAQLLARGVGPEQVFRNW